MPNTGKKLNDVTIAALVVALAYFIWERQSGHDVVDPMPEVAAVEHQAVETIAAEKKGPGSRTIAVLPFVNMSSDKEQEWFADGLTEEILNSLARTSGPAGQCADFVISPTRDPARTLRKLLMPLE